MSASSSSTFPGPTAHRSSSFNVRLKVIAFLSPKQGFLLSSHCLIGTSSFSFLSIFLNIIRHDFLVLLLMGIFLSRLEVPGWQEHLYSSSFCHLCLAQHTTVFSVAWVNEWSSMVPCIFAQNWIWEENLICCIFKQKTRYFAITENTQWICIHL